MLAARHDFSKTDRPGTSRRLLVPKPSLRRAGDERAGALASSILPHARPTDSDTRAASYALGRDPLATARPHRAFRSPRRRLGAWHLRVRARSERDKLL